MLQLVDLGQIDRVDEGESSQGTGDHREHKQHRERRAPGEFATPLDGSSRPTEHTAPFGCAHLHRLIGGDSQGIQAS